MEWNVVYAKYNGCKTFKAFDVKEGRTVGNIIYASLMEDNEKTRNLLQELANQCRKLNLVFQLRRNNKVIFQTEHS